MAGKMPEPVGSMASDGKWKKTKRVWIPEIDTDARAEIARLKQDLKLEERAAADGHKNVPPQSDMTLNEIQLDVCSHVYSGILMLSQFLDQQVDLAVQRAREHMSTAPDAAHLKDLTNRAIDRVFEDHRPDLIELRRLDLERRRDLRLFVHNNRLGRSAHYEESVVKVAGIIVGLFVTESIINGSLFAQVVSSGLMGGAILAGMISAINIISGTIAGLWGWRHIGHCRPILKSLGWAITIILHILALYWNLFVAHFREVAENLAARDSFEFDINQIRDATTNHISTHGLLGVESLQSWALLLLGIFIHFIAAKEGWDDFADRYPDYKKYDLRAKTAHDEYEAAMAELREDVRAEIEEIEGQAKASVNGARTAYQTAAELHDLALEREQEVRDSEEEWVSGGNRLLKTYREINLKIRDDGTEPGYFSQYPTAADYRCNNFGGNAPTDEVIDRARCVDRSIKELRKIRDDARRVADNAEAVLKDIHRNISNAMKGLDKRLNDESLKITTAAEEQLGDAPVRPARNDAPETAAVAPPATGA